MAGAGGLFGDSSQPGVLGTGQQRLDPIAIDRASYYDSRALEGEQNALQGNLQQVYTRQTPMAQNTRLAPALNMSASQGNAFTGQAAQGNATFGNAAQIGNMQMVNAPNLGPAAQIQGTQLGTQDQQFRAAQLGLANSLQNTLNGNGPSLAAYQLGQANAAASAQRMSQAASERGYGNAAGTNRNLEYQHGAALQNNAINAAQLGIQERLNAQNSLGNLLGQSRGQDIGAATSNAQLGQEAQLANQGAQNQFALQGAQMQLQAGQGNQAAANNATLQQAAYQQAVNEANQAAQNQFGLSNVNAQNQFGLANMSALNANEQANIAAQNASASQNATAQNNFALNQGQMNQQTALANQAANLQQQGLNDSQIKALLGASIGITNQEQANMQAYNQLAVQQNTGLNQVNQQAYQSAGQARGQLAGGVMGAIGGLAMMSDENQKKNVSSMSDSDVDKFTRFGGNMDSIINQSPAIDEKPIAIKPSNDDVFQKYTTGMQGSSNPWEKGFGTLMKGIKGKPSAPEAQGIGGEAADTGTLNGFSSGDEISMSDEKQKKNVKKGGKEIKDFLDNMGAHKYEYKNPEMAGAGEGEHFSPMAQELEQSKIGKSMVGERNGIKYVDYGKGFGALMATVSNLNDRIKRLEK